MSRTLGWLLFAVAAHAQSLDIYSEFERVDPFGQVAAPDRGIGRREILSPAVARNGYASFHVVVSVPPKESYLLYVATNPLDACRVALYREHFVETPRGWIPDSLFELERLPDFGTMPDPDDHLAGQTTRVYLLDLWIPPDSPVGRFRLEVQLKVANWIIRPLEIRVLEKRIPTLEARPRDPASLPAVDRGADSAGLDMLLRYFTSRPPAPPAQPRTVREILERNAIQDMALAATLPREAAGPQALMNRALDLLRQNTLFGQRLFGAEWYLRLRDYLYTR